MRHNTEFEVDLNLLANNFRLLNSFAPNNEIIFMVKANAYGHGILEISKFSTENLNVKNLGVASLGEALYIKEKLRNNFDVWVFSDTELTNAEVNHAYSGNGIRPVVSSLRLLLFYLENEKFNNEELIIKFDTGMNRLGISYKEVDKAIDLLKKYKVSTVKHIMTHFASSFIKLKPGDKTHQQYEKFKNIKKKFENAQIKFLESSCSNSGAIEQKFALKETHIRPGLMMYGPRSVGSYKKEDALWNGSTISHFKTTILKVEVAKKGMPIGYGGHVCHADGTLVYLPVGYGDGVLTYYSGLKLKYKNFEGKIIGRVNMDLIGVFFEGQNVEDFKLGDEFTIWSHEQDDVVELANQVKSIPYQVFTAITSRVPKSFKFQ